MVDDHCPGGEDDPIWRRPLPFCLREREGQPCVTVACCHRRMNRPSTTSSERISNPGTFPQVLLRLRRTSSVLSVSVPSSSPAWHFRPFRFPGSVTSASLWPWLGRPSASLALSWAG